MAIAHDPILGHLQPGGAPSAESGFRPWYSPSLDASHVTGDADFFFGSPLLINENANILLGLYNQQPHLHQQQSIDSDVIFAAPIECSRPRLSGEEASFLGNQSTTTNHKHLDVFSFENNYSAVQLDWQDQFVDLRYDGSDDWAFSALPDSNIQSGACSPSSRGSPSSTTPPMPVVQSGPRHHYHSSSSCSPPEDLAELVEVVDWALSPDHGHQTPVDQPSLYKDQQQVLEEIYRECEHRRSLSFETHSQGLSDTEMRSTTTVDAVSLANAQPTPSLCSYDERDEDDEDEDGEPEEEDEESLEARKKTQNRKAASRYRRKRKQQRRVVHAERVELERQNQRLVTQVQDAQREVDYLKSFLSEIRQKVVTVAA